MRAQGTVRKWTDKGYGFINSDDGQQYFAHIKQVRDYGHDDLLEGSRVEFDAAPSKRHPGKLEAHEIKVLAEPDE
jgi:CspA family cold shock protein